MASQHRRRQQLQLMRRRQKDARGHRCLEPWTLHLAGDVAPGAGAVAGTAVTTITASVVLLRRQETQLLAQLIGKAARLLCAPREKGARGQWRIAG